MRRSLGCLLLAAVCATACGRPSTAERPRRLVVRFDPLAPAVPTPTDLIKDPVTGKLAVPEGTGKTDAERELFAFIRTLDGWPVNVAAECDFGVQFQDGTPGAVDPASITPDSVLVLDISQAPAPVDVSRALVKDGTRLQVTPDGGSWARGRTYLVAVRGGDGGVQGAQGEPVEADVVFWFLRGKGEIASHWRSFPGANENEKKSIANQLEAARISLEPALAVAEASGFPADSLAALWSFTTEPDAPQFVYDPLAQRVPFPNDLGRDATGKVFLPPLRTDSADEAQVKAALNGQSGFSSTAAIRFESTHPLDPATLDAQSVRVYLVADGGLTPVETVRRSLQVGGRFVLVEPVRDNFGREPFLPQARYLVVVTDALKALDGRSVAEPAFNALLKFRAPLAVDGKSSLSPLDDPSAQVVEGARALFAPHLQQLSFRGVLPQNVRLIFSFAPLDSVPTLRALNDAPSRAQVPVSVTDVVRENALLKSGLPVPLLNTRFVVTGKIQTADRTDPATRSFHRDGHAEARAIPFTLCFPSSAAMNAPAPVVLFGHALTTAKESIYVLCDEFARAGYVLFAIDLPYHGDRSVCLEDAHCQAGSTCDAATGGVCRNAQGAATPLLRRTDFEWAGSLPIPASTGLAFFDTQNPFSARDHLQQALIDLSSAARTLREGEWGTALGGYALNGQDLSYVGMSLGGILGGTFAAAEPRIRSFVLNAAGADLYTIFTQSPAISPQFNAALTARGVVEDTYPALLVEMAVRWLFDAGDPVHFGRHARREPYLYLDPETGAELSLPPRRLLTQLAANDLVIPNANSRLLARLLDAPVTTYTPTARPEVGGHGFFLDPLDAQGTAARTEAINFLNGR